MPVYEIECRDCLERITEVQIENSFHGIKVTGDCSVCDKKWSVFLDGKNDTSDSTRVVLRDRSKVYT